MEYNVVLTKKPNSHWRALVPALPACEVEAETREEALAQIKDEITPYYVEVVTVEVPTTQTPPPTNGTGYTTFEQEWPHYGIFKDDPTLDEMFDEIERRRDAHRVGD